MKKIDIFSKRNVVTETFNELSRIIETSNFENQIRDFVKSMKIREAFLMKSDVVGVNSSELANKEKVFSEKSWLNLIDFLKTQLNLYENSENKSSVQGYITQTIDSHCYSIFGNNNISSKSKNVDDLNYFLTDLNGVTFSYDIDKKTILMFVSDTGEYTTKDNKYLYQFGYYVNNKIQINTNLLRIFTFDYFGNFQDLYKNLDNNLYLNFLKYAVGLEDEYWLSSFIVSEIRSNFQNIISSWIEESLKFNSKVFHLEFFPYNFYKDGTVVLEPNFESEYEMFKNTTVHQLKKMANNKKVVFQKDKSNNLLIGKRIVYFDEPIQDITFSEKQLSEFKSEIIPLLEKIQDKIFLKLTVNSVHPADSSKSNEEKVFDIIHSYQDKYGFYYNLCKLVDWYPKTLKILSIQNENLSCFGKVSYINQLKKKFNLNIDYTFFIFKSSSIKTEKDLFDIIGDDFENVNVLFEGSLSGAELEQYELMQSYGVKEEIASISLSY